MKITYILKLLFLSIMGVCNCSTCPTYQAVQVESHDLSATLGKPVGFTKDDTYFYVLDLDLGNYDSSTGVQTYNYVHLNIYSKSDFSLQQTLDLTILLTQLAQSNSLQNCQYQYNHDGPLTYFQNNILFAGIYSDTCNIANTFAYRVIEFDISTGLIRFISNLPRGYFGYNEDKSVVWVNSYIDSNIKEYTFNSDNYIEISTTENQGKDIVYIHNNGIWTFLAGYTIIEGGRIVPDTISKFETIESTQPLYKSELSGFSCLTQIIPDGDYIWAVSDDGAGTVEILKLDPTGTLVSGCEGSQTALILPQIIQSYAQNFGPLFLALGWIGIRRRK